MNIFVTSPSPVESALALDDLRLNKMILESAQMLCTALWWHGARYDWLYRPTHTGHPCSVWTRETRSNFEWLVDHALSMCTIYSSYSGRVHKCERIIQNCFKFRDKIPKGSQTAFANASMFKDDSRSLYDNYRRTMVVKWANDTIKLKWSRRKKPDWIKEFSE